MWITPRPTRNGDRRYRVLYRLGGRESTPRYGGSFQTKREALTRKQWIAGELAAMRVPGVARVADPPTAPTLAEAAERWQASRVDVSTATATYHRSALRRARPLLNKRLDQIAASDVAALVGSLAEAGKSRETIRKTVTVLAMVFDYAGITPNPARDRIRVRLPREDRPEVAPPTAEHVEAVYGLLAPDYRLPLLVLDATGMRVGELEALTWGDLDEARGRWRVSRTVAKTGYGRWVAVAPVLFDAVLDLCPRDDRHADRRVFERVTADRLRMAIQRACTAAGVPNFSPHDLRHRRISLMHLGGVPWARIGEHVGQRDLAVTANTYTHVLADEAELDYAALID
ncbi:MAG TPA: site-specific integrase [Gaiellaceae bacterium]|nr:site-specific integrase [Gaiellaceae bacterium]